MTLVPVRPAPSRERSCRSAGHSGVDINVSQFGWGAWQLSAAWRESEGHHPSVSAELADHGHRDFPVASAPGESS